MRTRVWLRVVPAVGVLTLVSWPLGRYVQKTAAENHAAEFMADIRGAQDAFRATAPGFAIEWESLTTACPTSVTAPPLSRDALTAMGAAGYRRHLRAASGAAVIGSDCHGRPTATDYYAAVEPESATTSAERALAMTGRTATFVFFDGVAPLERDMAEGGLATPLDGLRAFRIP